MLSLILEITKRHIMHSFLNTITIFSSLTIIRDSDVFSSYPAKIETLSIVSPTSTLNPAKTIDRFSAVLSASAKSLA
jgi:hypothetical protein